MILYPHEFNGQMLILARHLRELELDDLAELSQLDRVLLLRFEAEAEYPSAEVIRQLGNVLHFPPEFFVRKGRLYPPIGSTIQWFAGS